MFGIKASLVKAYHVRPDLINVDVIGVVHHVGGVASGGSHVDLQAEDIALLAKTLLVLIENKELAVEEPGVGLKSLDGAPACVLQIRGDLLAGIVPQVQVFVDDVHNRIGEVVAGLENDIPVGIADAVIGDDGAVDELLHDVLDSGRIGIESLHILLIFQLVGGGGAHTVVGLDDDGVAHLGDEGHAFFKIGDQVVAGGLHAGLGVELLHAAFVLDAVDAVVLETRGDVEVGAQLGIPQEPVFVIGLQPVDLAVFEGEEGYGAVDLIIVFQAFHLIIFRQGVAALRVQGLIGAVADAQGGDAVVFQTLGEVPVSFREIR